MAHPNIILQLVKSNQGNKCFGQVSQIISEIIVFIKSLFNFFCQKKNYSYVIIFKIHINLGKIYFKNTDNVDHILVFHII